MRKMFSYNLSNATQETSNQKQLFRHNMQSLYQFILEKKRKKAGTYSQCCLCLQSKNLGSVKQITFYKGISGVEFD